MSSQHAGPAPVAIVTGSGSGIGRGIATALDARGYSLVVHGFGQHAEGESFAAGLRDATYVDADLGDSAAAPLLVELARKRWGTLDVLVNNAGMAKQIPHADLAAVTPEFWDQVLRVNLLGPWFLCQAAQGALAESGGSIINVASIAGLTVSGSSIPYAVSKAGLVHLTKLLAVAMGPGVRVNAVAPGYIETERTRDWTEVRDAVLGNAPLARVGLPEDVASACLALVDSRYTTGAVLTVDGGLHLV